MHNDTRRANHRKPAPLEGLLHRFEGLLGPLEAREISRVELCNEPILYIVGCARSGTTLVFQYLAHTGLFTYPTNFVSRFYYAPYLGALLQTMLVDADFRNEIFPKPTDETFSSHLGKTRGPKSPHEFWYFWRRFFRFGDTQQLTKAELDRVDAETFIKELRAFQTVESRPLVLKGMILNWHIPFLAKLYSRSYFLFVSRSVPTNAASLIRSRLDFFGDISKWYSFKPPGYERIAKLGPHHQTAWQVQETNNAINEGLATLPPKRVFHVKYEEFCRDPARLVKDICSRWQKNIPDSLSTLPKQFVSRSSNETDSVDWTSVVSQVTSLSPRLATQLRRRLKSKK